MCLVSGMVSVQAGRCWRLCQTNRAGRRQFFPLVDSLVTVTVCEYRLQSRENHRRVGNAGPFTVHPSVGIIYKLCTTGAVCHFASAHE